MNATSIFLTLVYIKLYSSPIINSIFVKFGGKLFQFSLQLFNIIFVFHIFRFEKITIIFIFANGLIELIDQQTMRMLSFTEQVLSLFGIL